MQTSPGPRPNLSGLLCAALMFLVSQGSAAQQLPTAPSPDDQGGKHLRFIAREGTWLSVDAHPKGHQLVFDLLGDLYVMPTKGGASRLLRGGPAFQSQPVYSPNGQFLAFVSDESGSDNLWVMKADGSEAKMLSANPGAGVFASPAWAADGSAIYVSRREGRHGQFALWRYGLRGGTGVEIGGAPGQEPYHVLGVSASPDGRYLYMARKSTEAGSMYFTPEWHIARLDLDSGQPQPVVTVYPGAFRPLLSPDGRFLAYGTRRHGRTGLRLRDLHSGEDRWLAYPVQADQMDDEYNLDLLPGYAFAPDGASLWLSYGGRIQRLDVDTGEFTEVPFSAKVDMQIPERPRISHETPSGPVRARIIQGPVVSPVSAHSVALSALGGLYVVDTRGGQVRELVPAGGGAYQPAWSPDGKWIAYVSWQSPEGGHIWKIPASGGAPRRLTEQAAFFSDPVFSVDGNTLLALASNQFERWRLEEEVTPKRFANLVRLPAGGGEPRIVAPLGQGARRPFVGPKGQRVYVSTARGLLSYAVDGEPGASGEQHHFTLAGPHPWMGDGEPYPVSEAVLSADGRWVLTRVADQLHLLASPPAGMDTGSPVDVLDGGGLARIQVSREGANYFSWADGGETVVWSLGSTLYRRSLSSLIDEMSRGRVRASTTAPELAVPISHERDTPRGTLVLEGGTAITMNSGRVIDDAVVVIRDNRIAAVGERGQVPVPKTARRMDVSGKFLLPGFVDTHAHWYEIRHDVLELENWSFRINLAYGVTAGLDPQAMDEDMFQYQDMLDAGLMLGPRAWSVGQGIFASDAVESPSDAEELMARYSKHYRTGNVKVYLAGNRQTRQWLAQSARDAGMIATTEGNRDFKLGLTYAMDGFAAHEHALPVAELYGDVVQLFAQTGIGYTPTLLVSAGGQSRARDYFKQHLASGQREKVERFMPPYILDRRSSPSPWVPVGEHRFQAMAASAARLLRAGGEVGVGSHAEFQGLGFHWEMQALAMGGMSAAEILRAATLGGSRIIGRDRDIGSLETGKLADILILGANPLENIEHSLSIEQVMKNGRLYSAGTLKEIWPRKRAPAPLWFGDDRDFISAPRR